jgi:hypothetical protein
MIVGYLSKAPDEEVDQAIDLTQLAATVGPLTLVSVTIEDNLGNDVTLEMLVVPPTPSIQNNVATFRVGNGLPPGSVYWASVVVSSQNGQEFEESVKIFILDH